MRILEYDDCYLLETDLYPRKIQEETVFEADIFLGITAAFGALKGKKSPKLAYLVFDKEEYSLDALQYFYDAYDIRFYSESDCARPVPDVRFLSKISDEMYGTGYIAGFLKNAPIAADLSDQIREKLDPTTDSYYAPDA